MTRIARTALFAALVAIPSAASAQETCGWLELGCWVSRGLSLASGPKSVRIHVASIPIGASIFVETAMHDRTTNDWITVPATMIERVRLQLGPRQMTARQCVRTLKADGTVELTCTFR